MSSSIREARVLPEHAHLYPDLDPAEWVPACTLAEYVLERGLYQRRTRVRVHPRLLDESHFAFRGGDPRDDGWTGRTQRLTDTGTFEAP